MSISHISEQQLKMEICTFKEKQDYQSLASYLISLLSTGQVQIKHQAKAYNELGLAHLQLDQPTEAEKAFLSAIECDGEAVNPRYNRANIALCTGNYKSALPLLKEVLGLDENHAGAMYHVGLCYALSKEPEEALGFLHKSVALSPEAMGPHFWLAETLITQKKFAEALPVFEKAAELTPDHSDSIRGVAICLFETGKHQECIQQCDRLVEIGGGSEMMAFKIKGEALIEQGQSKLAALCHLKMAELDFDARDYLVFRAEQLAKHQPEQLSLYCETIAQFIPELDEALSGFENS